MILLVGLGHLGGVLLELMARQEWIGRIVACSRNPQRGEARCNLARLGGMAQGFSPDIEYLQLDLIDRERVAETVHLLAPDLILSTATMQTWWLPELLPEDANRRLRRARFGMWLPCHLAPTLALMEALAEAGFAGPVLTAPFPDAVNCVLGKINLAPTSGVGNLDEIVPKIRLGAAQHLGAPVETIKVQLVAHHALGSAAFSGAAEPIPYFLSVLQDEEDVTPEIDTDQLVFSPYPLPGGPAIAFLTSATILRLMAAVLRETMTLLHAPAPGGLPGGYPVLAGSGKVTPAPISGLSLEEAIDINERSHPFDGIERIAEDGTAIFVEETVETLRTELGYDCHRLEPLAAESRGTELLDRFREYAARHGVNLERFV